MFARSAALVLLFVFFSAPVAVAADDPSEWIPDDAVAVVRLKNPKAALAKVKRLVDEVLPSYSQLLFADEGIAGQMTSFLPGEIEWERDLWLAAFFVVDGQNMTIDVAYALPTKDAAALKKSLASLAIAQNQGNGQPPQCFVHNSSLICSGTRTTTELIEKRIAGEGRAFFSGKSKEGKASFEANDLSVSISVENYRKKVLRLLGENPEQEKELVTNFPRDLADFFESFAMEVEALNYVSEIYRIFLANSVNQLLPSISGETVLDTKSLTIGVNLGNSGVGIDAFVTFREASETLTRFKVPPSPLPDLERLPPARQVYVAATSFASSPSILSPLQIEQVTVDNEENRLVHAEYQQTVNRLKKFDYAEGAVAYSLPSQNRASEFLLTSFGGVDKPAVHRQLLLHLAATESTFSGFNERMNYTLKGLSERYGEHVADLHLVKFQAKDDAFSAEKKLYGSDGLEMRNLYLENRWVSTIGGGKAAMQDAVRRLQQPGHSDQAVAFRATRDQLLPEANFLLLADVAEMFCSVMLCGSDAGDADEDAKKIFGAFGDFSARHETSYLGVAAGTQSSGAHFRLYLPTEQAKSIAQLVLILVPIQF